MCMPPTFFLLLERSSRVDFSFNILRSASFKTSTKIPFVDILLSPCAGFCAGLMFVGNCRMQNKENWDLLARSGRIGTTLPVFECFWVILPFLRILGHSSSKCVFKSLSMRQLIQREEQPGTQLKSVSCARNQQLPFHAAAVLGQCYTFYSSVMKCKMQ